MIKPTTTKRVAELKAGDVVLAWGARFRVTEDARDSICHGPQDPATGWAMGPAGVAFSAAVCIEGFAGGYFWPGSPWAFQGATWVTVCVEA